MDTKLELQIENIQGRTAIAHSYFTSPLKLGTPNCRGERLQLVLMMASAGILKDDHFQYEITCGEDTKSVITEQSYSKIFDTGEGSASRQMEICLEKNASLFYCPSAVIPFAGSSFDSSMTVKLDKASEFVCMDILAAGRVGMGERFAFSHYRSRICVMVEEKPVWLEHCCLNPAQMEVSNMVFFDGHTHQGTFYYYGEKEKQERLLAYETTGEAVLAKTQPAAGICIRVLADTAQDIEEEFAGLKEVLKLEYSA